MVMWRWKNTVLKKKLYFLSFYFIFECHEVCPDADDFSLISRTASTFCFSVSDLSIKLSKQGRVHSWICAV